MVHNNKTWNIIAGICITHLLRVVLLYSFVSVGTKTGLTFGFQLTFDTKIGAQDPEGKFACSTFYVKKYYYSRNIVGPTLSLVNVFFSLKKKLFFFLSFLLLLVFVRAENIIQPTVKQEDCRNTKIFNIRDTILPITSLLSKFMR